MATTNFAKTYVPLGYSSSDLQITVKSGGGSKFGSVPFAATWWNATDYDDPADDPFVEIVSVTGISGDILTIVRAQEGTLATAKNIYGKQYAIAATYTAALVNGKMDGPTPTSAWRVKGDQFQFWNETTNAYHTAWLTGTPPAVQWKFGPADP